MANAKNSKFAAFCLFMTAWMLISLVGYFMILVNPLAPALKIMYNSTFITRSGTSMPESTWTSLLSVSVSSIIFGGLIGAISGKYLLQILSRKHTLQLGHVIVIIGTVIVALVGGHTRTYEAFIIGRLVTGFPLGIIYVLGPLIIAETSARESRDFWQSILGMAISFGALAGSIIAHPKILGNLALWPLLVSLGILPSLIYLVSSWWIPETPFYLVREGRKDEAMEALKKLRIGSQDKLEQELDNIQSEIKGTSVFGIKKILIKKQFRNQLIAACILQANLMMGGVNHVALYSDLVFIQAGIAADKVTFATIGIFALQFVASIFGSRLVNRFGGLKVLKAATYVIITAHVIFTVSQATTHLAPDVMPYLSIVAAALFMTGWSGGTNLATFALLGELTIEPTRPTVFSIAAVVLWFTSWFVGFLPSYLEKALGAYSMMIWLICTILSLIYFYIFLPDTKGKSVDEIQAKFKGKSKETPQNLPLI